LFNNVTFDVKRGESLVIVGASGQGKTSLLRCILGLLPTAHGQILVDHKEVCLRQLKGDVACVMQDDQLFSGTVADNICSFESARNHHAMVEAAQSANIDQDIEALPLGYDTLVGDMGSLLSGGQKQRLLLARALYRQPKILILDEATSHLDNASEQIINANIAKLNIIKIIVAHRQETIASADKVYQL
jgi:ATP-binding cassette subfamily B protein RaxB